MIGQKRLGIDPVFDGHHRKIGAIEFAGLRIQRIGTARAITTAEVIHANDEKFIGIQRLTRTNQVIPPAGCFLNVRRVVMAGDMVITGQGVTNQHGITGIRIQDAIGFINQREFGQHGTAFQWQRYAALKSLRPDQADGAGKCVVHGDHC